MTNRVWPADAVGGAPSYSGRAYRQVHASILAGATAARPLGARSGVRIGTPTTTVTATSTTWTVKPHAGIIDAQAAAEAGAYWYAIDANVSGTVTAAHATLPRRDIVWVRIDDPAEADGSSVPAAVPGYTVGAAASTPAAPAAPARAMVLAEINVPAAGSGAPTVTWVAPRTAAAGGIIPAASLPSTVLGTPTDGAWIDVAGALYRGDGSAWTQMAGGALSHIRVRATAPRTLTGGVWGVAPLSTLVDVAGDEATFVLNAGTNQVTVASAGLYALSTVISGGLATFAVQIRNAVTGEVLAQGPTGSGASQTNQASTERRLAAGAVLDVRAYPSANMNIVADTLSTPTYLSLTRLSA